MNNLLTSGVLATLYGIMAIVASAVVNGKVGGNELEGKPTKEKIAVEVSNPGIKDNSPK